MFCSSCGKKYQDGGAFCSGCGAKTGGSVTVQTAQHTQTTVVRDFKCNNCGSSLKIPTNSSASVRCPSCKTECIIERAIKNAEIAAKENIESGVPLTATTAKLHSIVVSVLQRSACIPLDIFEKVEVIREEHYCIPAYIFHCNGTESFNYEVANERAQTYTVDLGDRVQTRERTHIDWAASSGTASVRIPIFVSGNNDMAKQIKSIYGKYDPKKLVDIQELIYPTDVDTLNSNLPQTAAFNEFVVPIVEKELRRKAEEAISKQITSGLTLGGSNIQKETTRVFLGMYRIVFKYDDKEYSIYVNGDGSKWYWNEGLPVDKQREQIHEEQIVAREQALNSITYPDTTGLTVGMWICILFLFIPGAIICGVKRSNKKNAYYAELTKVENTYHQYFSRVEEYEQNFVKQFINRKQALRGIYSDVSGDPSAF
ncbi:MAG: zinc ribbon domain-containing protein [Oscillospiraceae bacterium]|jgi:hypothetical protein|nr:zinc ribbon domain-containing protein [Oscillospiraceae bacterium]